MSAYRNNVIADFAFSVDFSSTSETLSATLSVNTDKTTTFKHIEQMADKSFLDMLGAALAKGSEGISTQF
jgi:hypothetical protein